MRLTDAQGQRRLAYWTPQVEYSYFAGTHVIPGDMSETRARWQECQAVFPLQTSSWDGRGAQSGKRKSGPPKSFEDSGSRPVQQGSLSLLEKISSCRCMCSGSSAAERRLDTFFVK